MGRKTEVKEGKKDVHCSNCGNVFKGVIMEGAKCPKCGSPNVTLWQGKGLLVE